jgi:hypothetical protein
MSKNLDTKIREVKDLARDDCSVAQRHGLDHDRRFKFRAQGQMSHGGCGNLSGWPWRNVHNLIGLDRIAVSRAG